MSPSHASSTHGLRRWPILVAVAVVLLGAGVWDHHQGAPAVPGAPADLTSAVPPTGAESSSWYCAGGSGTTGGSANAQIQIADAGAQPVSGTVTVVNQLGATASGTFSVPAGQVGVVDPAAIEPGTWVAASLVADGGAVAVSQSVSGATGWAQAPCASATATSWYFASGSTAAGTDAYLSLFNPTTTTAVADLTFLTDAGPTQPAPFQGLVIGPGQLVVEDLGTYVQAQQDVATTVEVRSGRLVAAQLEVATGTAQGLSLQPGSPSPSDHWAFPATTDVSGATTTFAITNPTSSPEPVTVRVELPSGPVAPFTQTLAPDSAWQLTTSGASRIPVGVAYALQVTSSGGPGVVVARSVSWPTALASPRSGSVAGVPAADEAANGVRTWLLPPPGTASSPAVAGAAPLDVGLVNTGTTDVTVRVSSLNGAVATALAGDEAVLLHPGQAFDVGYSALQATAADTLEVSSSGPLAVMEDLVPSGMAGVVSQAGMPVLP